MRFVPFEVRYPPSWVFDPTMAHPAIELDRVPFAETWAAMEELSTLGIAKNIGEMINVVHILNTVPFRRTPAPPLSEHDTCATLED
jgi:hypothetical protein